MNDYYVVKKPWLLRQRSDGLEIVGYEESIVLECDEKTRCLIQNILSGQKVMGLSEVDLNCIKEVVAVLYEKKAIEKVPTSKPSFSRSESLRRLESLRKKVVGDNRPIKSIYQMDSKKSSYKSPAKKVFKCFYTTVAGKSDVSYGSDANKVIAELKSIMEALERRCCERPTLEDFTYSSLRDLQFHRFIKPQDLSGLVPCQVENASGLENFDHEKTYTWCEVVRFLDGLQALLPIDLVYYALNLKGRKPLYYASSSGVAADFDFEAAFERALVESLERDAFMITWLNRIVRTKIDTNDLDNSQKVVLESICDLGYNTHLVNLTYDTTPVVLAVAEAKDRSPSIVLGLGSSLNLQRAIDRSLRELEQMLYLLFRKDDTTSKLSGPKDVTHVYDHLRLYYNNTYFDQASFLWSGEKSSLTHGSSVKYNNIKDLVEDLRVQGVEVFYKDITHQDLRGIGVKVVRVIPFGLVPIYFGYGLEPVSIPRLRILPENMGISANPWPKGEVLPHPFA